MDSGTLVEHVSITLLVVVFHVLLLWMDGSASLQSPQAQHAVRRLWRKFVGLLFVVLVVFANATLLIPRDSDRPAALIAMLLIAVIYVDWRRGLYNLSQNEDDAGG